MTILIWRLQYYPSASVLSPIGFITKEIFVFHYFNTWICLYVQCILNSVVVNERGEQYKIKYRVIQEESAIFWEMIICVILSTKVHMNMGPILDGYREYGKKKIRTIL
jgi:hypothetical protein